MISKNVPDTFCSPQQAVCTKSAECEMWIPLNKSYFDAPDKSRRVGFRPAFPGQYEGSASFFPTFVVGVLCSTAKMQVVRPFSGIFQRKMCGLDPNVPDPPHRNP